VFAGYYIIGEMRHYLRDKLRAIRVPRHIHELAIRIYNFTKSLTPEEVKILTSEDMASALHVTAESVDMALQIDRRNPMYFDDVFSDPDTLNYEELLADKDYESGQNYADAKIIFNDIINKLPPEERVIVDMYYKQNMNKREIAKALMLTPMCVTRRMKQAFNIMSSMIVDNIEQENIEKGNLQSKDV
jgi:RNA polymerase sigma-B factor